MLYSFYQTATDLMLPMRIWASVAGQGFALGMEGGGEAGAENGHDQRKHGEKWEAPHAEIHGYKTIADIMMVWSLTTARTFRITSDRRAMQPR